MPQRVFITRSAADLPRTAEIIRRCDAAGVTSIEVLKGDRLTLPPAENERAAYAQAKSTLAVVVAHRAPASRNPFRPVPTGESIWPAVARRIASTATWPDRWPGPR